MTRKLLASIACTTALAASRLPSIVALMQQQAGLISRRLAEIARSRR